MQYAARFTRDSIQNFLFFDHYAQINLSCVCAVHDNFIPSSSRCFSYKRFHFLTVTN